MSLFHVVSKQTEFFYLSLGFFIMSGLEPNNLFINMVRSYNFSSIYFFNSFIYMGEIFLQLQITNNQERCCTDTGRRYI